MSETTTLALTKAGKPIVCDANWCRLNRVVPGDLITIEWHHFETHSWQETYEVTAIGRLSILARAHYSHCGDRGVRGTPKEKQFTYTCRRHVLASVTTTLVKQSG
jgi:hypothetical protein